MSILSVFLFAHSFFFLTVVTKQRNSIQIRLAVNHQFRSKIWEATQQPKHYVKEKGHYYRYCQMHENVLQQNGKK